MTRTTPVGPDLAVPGEAPRHSLGDDRCSGSRRSTPEAKARKVLGLERARQQTLLRRMESVRADMAVLESVLFDLLSDPAFVALLNHQGYGTMPRLLWNRLSGRDS